MEKDQESLHKYFAETRQILHGDGTYDLDAKLIQDFVDCAIEENIPVMIQRSLPLLEFEARKDAAATYNGLVRAFSQAVFSSKARKFAI